MSADLTTLRRGLVLRALQPQYPFILVEAALTQQVAEYYPEPKDLERDLAYLTEKGLLIRQTRKVLDLDVPALKLTAKGLDLVEGRLVEPGITVGA